MTPETEAKLAKVRKYSASLKTLFHIASAFVGLAGLVSLILTLTANGSDTRTINFAGISYAGDGITWPLQIVVAIAIAMVFTIIFSLLHNLAQLFGHYAKGEIFTAGSVRRIRNIGVTVFMFVAVWIYAILASFVLQLAPSTALPQTTTVGIGIPGPLAIVTAGIIIMIISWVMDVGRELSEEHDLTV
jgi:hypothetical protein